MDTAKQSLLSRLKTLVQYYAEEETPCSHTVVRLGQCYRALYQVEQEGYADVKPDINVATFRQTIAALTARLVADEGKVPRCRKIADCDRCRGLSLEYYLGRLEPLDVLHHTYSLHQFKKGNYGFH